MIFCLSPSRHPINLENKLIERYKVRCILRTLPTRNALYATVEAAKSMKGGLVYVKDDDKVIWQGKVWSVVDPDIEKFLRN